MASDLFNASLLRTRQPRPPANSSRPLQATSGLTTSTTSAASATATISQLHSAVSNVSLFLTNLRLLDLDLHPDWPGINPSTFSAKDAAQGQRKRIQCVEWALYQLFCLWDPEEARNKLQPFFPPLDQVQSLNLRAALLRSLEQAKKNGVLGRDVLIRKTMLDECKGERMEEALAVFSSAVLKKLVAEQQLNQLDHPALAQTLALENRGYSGQTTDLRILVLAHRATLSRHLRDKDAARARYNDFSEVLHLKGRTLARRREQAKALGARERENGACNEINDNVKHDIWRKVRNNWSGNERWMDTLIYGDMHSGKDGLLSTPFDKVWRRVQAGRLADLEDPPDGLLQQLDRRVRTQKERLEKWCALRADITGREPSEPPNCEAQPSNRQKGIDLDFKEHENLNLGRLSPRKLAHGRSRELTVGYKDLIYGLRQELTELIKPSTSGTLGTLVPQRRTVELHLEPAAEEVVSEISELDEEGYDGDSLSKAESPGLQGTDLASASINQRGNTLVMTEPEATDEDEPATVRNQRSLPRQIQQSQAMPSQKTATTPTSRVLRTPSPRRASPHRVSPVRVCQPPVPSPKSTQAAPSHPQSPTQELADQILASMNAASPSPVKKPRHTLSLAERTRLSMVRRNSRGPRLNEDDEDDEEPDLVSLTIRTTPSVTVSPVQPIPQALGTLPAHPGETEEHGYEDLVSRTRRSMAGFEAAKKKAQLERRRSQRQSSRPVPPASGHRRDGSTHFPAVDEEPGDTTLLLAEELMANEQDDYEAIFKSRPKIKTSPVGSPAKGWED